MQYKQLNVILIPEKIVFYEIIQYKAVALHNIITSQYKTMVQSKHWNLNITDLKVFSKKAFESVIFKF